MVVEIAVRGEAEGQYAAERGIVTMAASFEHVDKQAAYDAALAVHQAITSQLTDLADRDAVLTWSSGQVGISSHRPWLDNGGRGNVVHTARIDITAEFSDFDRLTGFIDYWAGRDGTQISGLAWDVLERNRRAYEATLRKAAVEDAVHKAQAYADALRLGRVVPTRLADPGAHGGPIPMAFAAKMEMDSGGGLQLTPAPVVIQMAVDAGFAAD